MCSSDLQMANASTSGTFQDAFVLKLSQPVANTPIVPVYSTFFGGTGVDIGRGIDVDPSGNAWMAIESDSPGLQTDGSAFNGGEVLLVKLNPAASAVMHAGYTGGNGFDAPSGLALRPDGNAIVVVGQTDGGMPYTNPFQTAVNGIPDGFIAQFGERAITVTPLAVDFGTLILNTQTPAEQNIRIENTGFGEDLTITSLLFTGDNLGSVFTAQLDEPMPKTLAPGEAVTATIGFAPNAAGTTYNDTLLVTSDDPDRPVVAVAITGRTR